MRRNSDAGSRGAPPSGLASWRRTRARRALVLLLPSLALLLLLAAAEVVARLTLTPIESLDVFVRSPSQQDDFSDAQNVRIFEGDALLFWRLKPNLDRVVWDFTLVSTNPQGLRQPRPVTHKPKGRRRIICLGDSVTFGYRVPLVFPSSPEDYDRDALPFPLLLEQRLAERHPAHDVEVLNLGVPGYTSRHGRVWLEATIGTLEPDLVVLCFGWNDVAPREASDQAALPMGRMHVLARRLASHSQLLLRATLALRSVREQARDSHPALPVPRSSQDEFVAEILATARLARAHDAEAVVVAPIFGGMRAPSPEARRLAAYRRALAAAAPGEGVPLLEIPELTEATFPGNQELFPVEPIHPGNRGHRVLAEALLRFLDRQGILARLGLDDRPTTR